MIYKDFNLGNIICMENGKYEAVVENSADYLIVRTDKLEDMTDAFHKCIDDYIKKCEEIGKEPFITVK
jgi:predicted HicB family RNase H-like nuclease